MKIRAASCPSCGGGVEFRVSTSLVTVCPYCNCVVARGDKAVEDHGKVADLIDTNSPIVLGVSGHWHRQRFDVIGRVQYKHPAGGVWDEWYLAFGNDSWAWLAEAQGKRYITFEKKLKSGVKVPDHESLKPGDSITLGSRGDFTVGEVGVAQTGSAQGEIPGASFRRKITSSSISTQKAKVSPPLTTTAKRRGCFWDRKSRSKNWTSQPAAGADRSKNPRITSRRSV